MRRRIGIALALCTAVILSSCSGDPDPTSENNPSPSQDDATAQARTVTACDGREVTFDAVPERVVAMDASSAAFLIELGVGDRIVGLSGTSYIQDYEGDMRVQLEAIEVLSDGPATQELVLAAEPDLVVGVTDFSFGKFEGTASLETLTENNIKALWACETMAEGVSTTLAPADDYIEQLATAMDAEEAGAELTASIADEVASATAAVEGKQVPTLFYTGPAEGNGAIFTRGGQTFVNGLLAVSGAQNIAAGLDGNIVEISAEQVVADDPQLIVATIGMAGMGGPETEDDVRNAILADPLLSTTSAVKNDRIIVLPTRLLLAPNLLNAQAVAEIASAVAAVE